MQTYKKYVSHSDFWNYVWRKKQKIAELFPDTTVFLLKLVLRTDNMKNIRELLTKHIVLYRRSTYIEPDKNILEHFCKKMQFLLWV